MSNWYNNCKEIHMSRMYLGKGRTSNRLIGYDYRNEGWYFVTICTDNHREFFGSMENCHKADFNYFAWQKNYFDRIIRNKWELMAFRKYILNNPQTYSTSE